MNKKIAFIFGITGQDGSYLANLLINKNFKIFGFTRSKKKKNLVNLEKLSILDKVSLFEYLKNDNKFIEKKILKIKPSQIYILSGLSSVKKSFSSPIETYRSNIIIPFKILEICRKKKLDIKIYNSVSTDCFGNQKTKLNERSNFYPVSPYAKSKSYAYWLIKYYRETFNVKCVSGIVSNHESILRNKNFVSKKIIDKRLTLIKRQKKLGLDTAHKLSYEYAKRNGYEKLITLDADLSHEPNEISKFINLLNQYDFVIGSRYIKGAKNNQPLLRYLISSFGNKLIKILLSSSLNEHTTSYRGFNLVKLKNFNLNLVKSSGYSFFMGTIHLLKLKNVSMCEIPIIFNDRVYGISKIPKIEIFRTIFNLLKFILIK